MQRELRGADGAYALGEVEIILRLSIPLIQRQSYNE